MALRGLSLLIFFVVALSSPAEGVLRVVGDRNFPPFMFLDERGEPSGMDAAVARLVGERMGEEVSIDLLPWAEAVLALERGSADILAAMRVTPEREGRYRFALPHCINKLTAFTRVAATHISTSADLWGRRVGVQRRDLAEGFCRRYLPESDLWLYDDQPQALRALADGEVDAFVGNEAVVYYTIARDHLTDLFRALEAPLLSSPYAMAVRSDDQTLAAAVNKALALLEQDGTLPRLQQRWTRALPQNAALRRQLLYAALGAALLGGVGALGMMILGWQVRRATRHLEEEKELLRREVEERQRVERNIERQRRFIGAVLEHVPEAILVKDLSSGRYTMLNRAVETLFGLSRDQLEGRTDEEIFGLTPGEIFAAQDREVAQSSRAHTFPEVPVLTPHRESRLFTFTKTLLPPSPDDPSDHLLAIVQDVTERHRAEEALRFASFHDALTGLHNRGYFEEEMRRLATGRFNPVGILVCDVDGLRIVNNVAGHAAGDALIRGAAEVLRRTFRSSDVVARIGGDEFAVLLPQCPAPVAQSRCRDLAHHIEEWNAGSPLYLGLSLGLAHHQEGGKPSMERLFREADQAMYRHKEARREEVMEKIFARIASLLGKGEDDPVARRQWEDLRSRWDTRIAHKKTPPTLADLGRHTTNQSP